MQPRFKFKVDELLATPRPPFIPYEIKQYEPLDRTMSRQDDKDKRTSRLHADDTAIKKQVKIAKAHGIEIKEPHKLVKHHALDCGVPNCPMCSSPRKTYKEPTIQEKSFDQTKAWVNEGEEND